MGMDAQTIRALTTFNEIVDKMKLDPKSVNAEITPSQDGSGKLLLVVKATGGDPTAQDPARLAEVLDKTPSLGALKDTFTKHSRDTIRGFRAPDATATDLAAALADAKELAPMARTRAAS